MNYEEQNKSRAPHCYENGAYSSVLARNGKTFFIYFYTHEEQRGLPLLYRRFRKIKPEKAHIMFHCQPVFMQQEEEIFLLKTRITANKMQTILSCMICAAEVKLLAF
jgi:hypothetical protein